MLVKYVYSKRAEYQLKNIYLETARKWGIEQADRYDSGLLNSIKLLAENPKLGRNCDYIRKGYRRHEYKRHIIFYRQQKNNILITNIIYDSIDLNSFFQSK